MISCWPNLIFLFDFHYFIFFLIPWVGCVRWGLRASVLLSPTCLQVRFFNNNKINNMFVTAMLLARRV